MFVEWILLAWFLWLFNEFLPKFIEKQTLFVWVVIYQSLLSMLLQGLAPVWSLNYSLNDSWMSASCTVYVRDICYWLNTLSTWYSIFTTCSPLCSVFHSHWDIDSLLMHQLQISMALLMLFLPFNDVYNLWKRCLTLILEKLIWFMLLFIVIIKYLNC